MTTIILADPFPIDQIGPHLNTLKQSVIKLQMIDPRRMYGDRATIDAAILALMLVRNRIIDANVNISQAAE